MLVGPTVEDFNSSWFWLLRGPLSPCGSHLYGKNLLFKSVLAHCGYFQLRIEKFTTIIILWWSVVTAMRITTMSISLSVFTKGESKCQFSKQKLLSFSSHFCFSYFVGFGQRSYKNVYLHFLKVLSVLPCKKITQPKSPKTKNELTKICNEPGIRYLKLNCFHSFFGRIENTKKTFRN